MSYAFSLQNQGRNPEENVFHKDVTKQSLTCALNIMKLENLQNGFPLAFIHDRLS